MPEIQQGQHSNYCPIFLAQCIYLYDPGDSQIYIEGHFFFSWKGKGFKGPDTVPGFILGSTV